MRPLQHLGRLVAKLALGASLCVGPSAAIGALSLDQPETEVEEFDLTMVQPETTIAPFASYALPSEEFPDAVVVDLPHRKAYAATEFVAINVLSLLSAAWIEAMALLAAGLSLLWIRRVARRPQQPGQLYCRRCNYLLTSLQRDVCPECGAEITGRGQMIGRRPWPRLSAAILLLLATLGLYAAYFRRVPRLVWPDTWPAWWSRSLDEVARANSKYQWLIQHSRVLSRLVEIDLNDAGATRTLWTGTRSDVDHINGLFLSDDASRLTVWHTDGLQAWALPDCKSAARLDDSNVSLPFSFLAITGVEMSGDGRTALLVGPDRNNTAIAIDVDSGRELWKIEYLVIEDISRLHILHGSSLDRLIVAADVSSTGITDLSEWYVDDKQHPNRMRHFSTSAYALGPRLARNGFGPLIWASDLEQVEAWNLQTERVARRIRLPMRSVLLFAWPGDVPRLIITMFDQDSRTWIVDAGAGRVLAQLDGTPMRTRSTRLLQDGHTLAVWGYDGDLSHRVLQLYDLSSIAPTSKGDQ